MSETRSRTKVTTVSVETRVYGLSTGACECRCDVLDVWWYEAVHELYGPSGEGQLWQGGGGVAVERQSDHHAV